MATQLSLYQGACLLIKQRPVATLVENTIPRVSLDAVYTSVLQFMLEAAEWKFAVTTAALTPASTPTFGYAHYFSKPADYVRIVNMSVSPTLWPALIDFTEQGQQWAANCNPLYVRYVSNDASFGTNLAKWTAYFERAFMYELAYRVAPHLTKMSTEDMATLGKDRDAALETAKQHDVITQPIDQVPVDSGVLALYNGALLLIKAPLLTSLSDNQTARVYLDTIYNDTLKFMLEAGEWRCAAKAVSIDPSTDIEPQFGYNYFYVKPDDYVRLIRISSSPYLFPTLDDFSEEGPNWAANCNPLFVIYVSDSTSYGLNMSAWGGHFRRAFHHELAVRVAPHLAPKMTVAEMDRLQRNAKNAMHEAKSKDAINLPAERPPPGLLVQSRLGRSGYDAWSWQGPGS